MRRWNWFVIVTVLVFNLSNLVPIRLQFLVAYFGAVLAAYGLLCDEKKSPEILIARGVLWLYAQVWQVWVLFTDPTWVIFRRVGLAAKTQRTLLRIVRHIGMDNLKGGMTEHGYAELNRLIALTKEIRSQTRALHVRSKKSYYPMRVVIALRVYRLSEKTVPALEMAERIYMSVSLPFRGLEDLFSQMMRDVGRRRGS